MTSGGALPAFTPSDESASDIQAGVPARTFACFDGGKEFELYALAYPAGQTCTDFYDFFFADENHLVLVMADVSGRGASDERFAQTAEALIKNRALLKESPAQILDCVNERLLRAGGAQTVFSVWLAAIDISCGRVLAVDAGHEPPAICRKNGRFKPVKYRRSPALAAGKGVKFKEHEFNLRPGDRLFVCTDGVPRAADAQNLPFGVKRTLAALNREQNAAPKKLLENLKGDIDAFAGDAPQVDDIAMMCFLFKGAKKEKIVNELTLDATVENLKEATAFIDACLEEHGCSMKAQMQIDVALEELFVNIAHYAYKPDIGSVTLRFEVDESINSAVVTFIDSGVPYDPLKKEDPDITLPANERQIGGLGIFMVKKSMDDVRYEYKDGKNVLRITKKMA